MQKAFVTPRKRLNIINLLVVLSILATGHNSSSEIDLTSSR